MIIKVLSCQIMFKSAKTTYLKEKTQNHALQMTVNSLGYSVFINLSLLTNTSYKHIQTINQNDPDI